MPRQPKPFFHRGWWVTDVSFYTTELPQYALIELARGLTADVIHVAGAMTYVDVRGVNADPTVVLRFETNYTEVQPKLAAELNGLLGGKGKVFFSNSGAEANECAIKLARRHGQQNCLLHHLP